MNLKAKVDNTSKNLKISIIDDAELDEFLEENGDRNIDSDEVMHNFFENLVANSEFEWVTPEDAGALTDSPLLATKNEDEDIVCLWYYKNYAIRSPIQDVIDLGEIVFSCHKYNEEYGAFHE